MYKIKKALRKKLFLPTNYAKNKKSTNFLKKIKKVVDFKNVICYIIWAQQEKQQEWSLKTK